MLSIEHLRKTYPGAVARTVLADVSLELSAGECVAIMGDSGVGKSTLLNIIAGLDVPDSGDVRVEGVLLNTLSDDERTLLRRRRIGFVFQAFHLLPYMNVAANVALPLTLIGRNKSETEPRVDELLHAVGLASRAHALPRELSGGEMQRVAVARALAHRPALILADEPTGNLDAESAVDVLQLMRNEGKRAGAIVITVTHSMSAALVMDRILKLQANGLHPLT